MQDNGDENKLTLVSGNELQAQEKQVTSENLPKNVSMQLYRLMVKVVEKEISPNTVRAACNCATEIHRMLKLNQEIKKNK